jgi:hypothetical protein
MGLSKMKINPELMAEFWQVSQETQRNLTRLLEHCELLEPHSSVGKKNEGLSNYLREYEVLGEEFHAAMTLKDFCTIKSEVVGDVDASSHEGSLTEPQDDFLEVHASTHIGEVCNEVDKTSAFDTPLELSYETDNTSAYDGHVDYTHDDYDELCVELSMAHSSSSIAETQSSMESHNT